MTTPSAASILSEPVAEAARQAAGILFRALSLARVRDPESPSLSALWDVTKILNALSGSLDGFRDVPQAELPQAQWYEALLQAEGLANRALTRIAAGLTPEQAARWLEEKDAVGTGMDTLGTGGTIELAGLVLEPAEDGTPLCGWGGDITCEVCGRAAGTEISRRVETGPYGRTADVCSVPCARAAYAGEHNG